MDSYTNPYGSQPSIPNGGQFQPTNYPPQGDIILTPSQPRKFDLKRILILVGIGLAVLTLFIVVIVVISGNNRTASEAKAADRAEKVAMVEKLYKDYSDFLKYYKEIGYIPSETMAGEIDDTSKLFVVKKSTLSWLEIDKYAVEKDIEDILASDFSVVGDENIKDIGELINDIKNGLENMDVNIQTLSAFYDTFIVPVEKLDEETASGSCDLVVYEIDGLTGFDIESAIFDYNQAYCSVNDALYYGSFDGTFSSFYVANAKESLINTLLNVDVQDGLLDRLSIILENIGGKTPDNENYTEDNL